MREYVIQSPARSFDHHGKRFDVETSYFVRCIGIANEFGPLEKARRFGGRSLAEAAMQRFHMGDRRLRVIAADKAA